MRGFPTKLEVQADFSHELENLPSLNHPQPLRMEQVARCSHCLHMRDIRKLLALVKLALGPNFSKQCHHRSPMWQHHGLKLLRHIVMHRRPKRGADRLQLKQTRLWCDPGGHPSHYYPSHATASIEMGQDRTRVLNISHSAGREVKSSPFMPTRTMVTWAVA